MVRILFLRTGRLCLISFIFLATVFKADPLDPARGKQYREKILRWGGSREELDSLKVGFVSLVISNIMALIGLLIGLLGERARCQRILERDLRDRNIKSLIIYRQFACNHTYTITTHNHL